MTAKRTSRLFPFFTMLILAALALSALGPPWGFYGHRRINRMAVFTLPPEMAGFYKKHIEYLTEHAVDPDKRRYATRHEAVRHYIDIDHWGSYPFADLPRDWTDALVKHTIIYVLDSGGDTLSVALDSFPPTGALPFLMRRDSVPIDTLRVNRSAYYDFFRSGILPQYYEEEWIVSCAALNELFGIAADCYAAFAVDHFSGYGILPYHLERMQYNLTMAFRQKDVGRILRLSAEMGHYIGDAHVPLHTTENYNGQLTGQTGIHAFWESRLPELFAEREYDFFVGPAEYWDQPAEVFWETVLSSHLLVDSVLAVERRLSATFPRDRQYCYEDRLDATVRTQCEAYARAYHEAMDGMVEERMRRSIHAIGSSWFTAWVNAGQPNLNTLDQPLPEDNTVPTRDPGLRIRVHE